MNAEANEPKEPTPLINATHVRRMALDVAAHTGRKRFTRVSHDFLVDCNAHLAAYVRQRVHTAPSVGKTL
jgi:hypothetical protein